MNYNSIIKECRKLAKAQNLTFKRSSSVGTLNGKACYEIQSVVTNRKLHMGGLATIWETLLSENLANH